MVFLLTMTSISINKSDYLNSSKTFSFFHASCTIPIGIPVVITKSFFNEEI